MTAEKKYSLVDSEAFERASLCPERDDELRIKRMRELAFLTIESLTDDLLREPKRKDQRDNLPLYEDRAFNLMEDYIWRYRHGDRSLTGSEEQIQRMLASAFEKTEWLKKYDDGKITILCASTDRKMIRERVSSPFRSQP